jgi:hypothetical protein
VNVTACGNVASVGVTVKGKVAASPGVTVCAPLPPVARAKLKSADVTVSVIAVDVLAMKFVSPEYTAVIVSTPRGIVGTTSVATPLAFAAALPRTAVPFRNCTVPVGVPVVVEVTVAVNVIGTVNTGEAFVVVKTVLLATCAIVTPPDPFVSVTE